MTNFSQQTCHGRWMSDKYEPGLVSVIIPTYNRADKIGDVLASVFAQSYRPIEIIVIDDGSTDNTKEVLDRWAERCSDSGELRLLFLQQENRYAPVARNYGLVESSGEFIQFLDSDDLMAPSKIEQQVSQLSSSDSKIAVYGRWRFFQVLDGRFAVCKEGLEGNVKDWDCKFDFNRWVAGNGFIPPHCLLWKRSDLQQVGPLNEALAANQDGEHFMRYVFGGGQLIFCPDSWVYWRSNVDSSSHISSDDSLATFESRLYVIRQLEKQLGSRGIADEHRLAISIRYATLACRYAFRSRDLTKICLERSRALSPTGKVPYNYSYPLITRILGLTLKQRIGRFIHRTLGTRPCGDSTVRPMIIRYVDTVQELCSVDEIGDSW